MVPKIYRDLYALGCLTALVSAFAQPGKRRAKAKLVSVGKHFYFFFFHSYVQYMLPVKGRVGIII